MIAFAGAFAGEWLFSNANAFFTSAWLAAALICSARCLISLG